MQDLTLWFGYQQADMQEVSVGQFDAIISMFNAIGHLTINEFNKTVQNAADHLNPGGLYVFDIFNTEMIRFAPEYEHIDSMITVDDKKYVRFTQSQFDNITNKVTLTQRTYIQKERENPEVIHDCFTLQTYNEDLLKEILLANGFEVAKVTGEGMLDVFGMQGLCHFAIGIKSQDIESITI